MALPSAWHNMDNFQKELGKRAGLDGRIVAAIFMLADPRVKVMRTTYKNHVTKHSS